MSNKRGKLPKFDFAKYHPQFVQVVQQGSERLIERNIHNTDAPSRVVALNLAIQHNARAFDSETTDAVIAKAEAFYAYMATGEMPGVKFDAKGDGDAEAR